MEIMTSERLEGIEEYSLAKIIREAEVNSSEIINLAVGNPDLSPPAEVIRELKEAASRKGSHSYQPSGGGEHFRKAAAGWYRKIYGVNLNPSKEIISLIGSKEGIFHISLAMLNSDDRVFVPDPGYPIYSISAKIMGAEAVPYNISSDNNWQIDFTELEEKFTGREKIIWINTPHMPTGTRLTADTLKRLIRFAEEKNILIVNDNPYSMILNSEKPMSILSLEGGAGCSVELCSLSKSFNIPGFRVALAAGNQKIISALVKSKSITDSGTYLPLHSAAVKAFELNDSWFNVLNEEYKSRKIEAHKMAGLLGCNTGTNTSGMFLWCRLPIGADDKTFCSRLFQLSGILLTPGSIYGENGNGYVRISLCRPAADIQQAINRIEKINKRELCW